MFLFRKKSEQIKELSEEIDRLKNQLYYNKKVDIKGFISILEQIQKIINTPMQWKQKITKLNGVTKSEIEKYKIKISELDIMA